MTTQYVTGALQQILIEDDAIYLSVNYDERGDCYAIASIDEVGDEVAVYEGRDLTPAAHFEANAWPWRPRNEEGPGDETFVAGALTWVGEEGYVPTGAVAISAGRIRMLNHPDEFVDRDPGGIPPRYTDARDDEYGMLGDADFEAREAQAAYDDLWRS